MCLSSVNKYDVRLKLLRERVYQFRLQSVIITPRCTQRRIPECVKAVIISKKRTMQESASLPLCVRTESSQCALLTSAETGIAEVLSLHVTVLSFSSGSPGVYINFHIHFLIFSHSFKTLYNTGYTRYVPQQQCD